MDLTKSFDRYVIQARLMPALLVVFPLALLVVVWLPAEGLSWKLLSGLVSLVLLSLIAQIGRDSGKRLEPDLFQRWGGKPSVLKLRHRHTDLPWITLSKLHDQLARDLGVPAPSPKEEEMDPDTADQVYAAYGDHLRDATRGDKILFSENVGYGFRRNLLGMKSAGLLCAILGTTGCVVATIFRREEPEVIVPAVAAIINAFLAACWLCRVNPGWVRQAGEAYADRLIRAYLASGHQPAKATS